MALPHRLQAGCRAALPNSRCICSALNPDYGGLIFLKKNHFILDEICKAGLSDVQIASKAF